MPVYGCLRMIWLLVLPEAVHRAPYRCLQRTIKDKIIYYFLLRSIKNKMKWCSNNQPVIALFVFLYIFKNKHMEQHSSQSSISPSILPFSPRLPSAQALSLAPPEWSQGVPRTAEWRSHSSVSWFFPRVSSGHARDTSPGRLPGGIWYRCPSHLSWLLSMWWSSGSTPSISRARELLTLRERPFTLGAGFLFFGHYSKFMTIGEGGSEDWLLNRELHLSTQLLLSVSRSILPSYMNKTHRYLKSSRLGKMCRLSFISWVSDWRDVTLLFDLYNGIHLFMTACEHLLHDCLGQ